MKKILSSLLLVPSLLTACSYSQGFHRDQVREAAAGPPVVDDSAIQAELKKRPQLPKSFRLGVFFQPLRRLGGSYSLGSTRFTGAEKAEFLRWARSLPASEVGSVIPVAEEQGGATRADAWRGLREELQGQFAALLAGK